MSDLIDRAKAISSLKPNAVWTDNNGVLSCDAGNSQSTPTEDAFKVTLQGLTLNEVEKVANFVTDVLMKNRNQMAYKYGRMYE